MNASKNVSKKQSSDRKEHNSGRLRQRRNRQQADFNGIHRRRDKRNPLPPAKLVPGDVRPTSPAQDSQKGENERWKEALMLWLSWDRTQKKLTERMFKPGQNPQKLEAMMDEQEQLRRSAIHLSEKLLA